MSKYNPSTNSPSLGELQQDTVKGSRQPKKMSRVTFLSQLVKSLAGFFFLASIPLNLFKPTLKKKAPRSAKSPVKIAPNPFAVKRDKKG